MTPTRFRECLALIGWTQRGLADQLGIHETRTRRWASGRYPIPEKVAVWLEGLAAEHARYSAPADWMKKDDDEPTER